MGIVPSVYDHCPYTVLEMMAFKIPIIASRINGLDEILDDSNCVFIDQCSDESGEISFDIQQISAAILELAGNVAKRKKLADQAYKILSEKFTSLRMAKEMIDLFEKITESEEAVIQK
jgi:glycosyltransferase involved in cell wall biosynthesis